MSDTVTTLMNDNLLAVFNERDQSKRQAAQTRTYAAGVRWTDAEGTTTGLDALEAKCIGLQSGLGELQFEAEGPIHELPGFGYLAWRLVNPATGEVHMTGFDAARVEDGKITELWTVLIPPH